MFKDGKPDLFSATELEKRFIKSEKDGVTLFEEYLLFNKPLTPDSLEKFLEVKGYDYLKALASMSLHHIGHLPPEEVIEGLVEKICEVITIIADDPNHTKYLGTPNEFDPERTNLVVLRVMLSVMKTEDVHLVTYNFVTHSGTTKQGELSTFNSGNVIARISDNAVEHVPANPTVPPLSGNATIH